MSFSAPSQPCWQQPFCFPARPAAGAPDADYHRRIPDVHGFVFFKGFGHIEEETAGMNQDFQIFALFLNFHLALRVHLGQLRIVKVNPGIAPGAGVHLISAVELQALDNRDALKQGNRQERLPKSRTISVLETPGGYTNAKE